jgi:SAM-dependent methyltransferase
MSPSWDAEVFDRLYARSPDPWDFTGSAYEQAKYDATLSALGDSRFDEALEVGCSIGVFTRRLAARCGHLLALDGAQAALDQAAARCRDLTQVQFRRAMVPADFPPGTFDLILFSEVLYFLDAADVRRTASLAQANLAPEGLVVLVNWTGETNTPVTGDAAVALFAEIATDLKPAGGSRDNTYRIDVFRRKHVLF